MKHCDRICPEKEYRPEPIKQKIARMKLRDRICPEKEYRPEPIVLPSDILAHVLSYFPRRQLVDRFSHVNSAYFQVSNQLVPNLHALRDYSIIPSPTRLQKFQNTLKRKCFNRMLGTTNHDVEVKNVLEGMWKRKVGIFNKVPPWVAFPFFTVSKTLDDIEFFRRAKRHFFGSKILLDTDDSDIDCDNNSRTLLRQELLTDILTNPSQISIDGRKWETIFQYTGVRNCNKLMLCFWHSEAFKCKTEQLLEWIHWKETQPDSRRHLEFVWNFEGSELLNKLKQEFLNARSQEKCNYMITFTQCNWSQSTDFLMFDLDNDSTGECLTFFSTSYGSYRLWRRIPTYNDDLWLCALRDEGKESIELAKKTGFDEEFYDYYRPKYADLIWAFFESRSTINT